MNKNILWMLLATIGLQGQEVPILPSHPLEKRLSKAERDFERAQRMFDPYYTGPLLAPGVTIPAPGHFAVQPYLFLKDTYGAYDDRGHGHSIPNIYSVTGNFLGFAGITRWMGVQVSAAYTGNWQRGNSGSNWNDTSITLLFPLLRENLYRPGILLGVRETFPSGKYQNLNPDRNRLDATGNGAYQTSFFLNFAKLIWSVPHHPMRTRLSLQYKVPYRVRVHNFNTFGGGFGTNGKVRLPNAFAADFGYEYSFTQQWVAALDILYTYNQKITFSGFPGFASDCTEASVGGPSSQNLSLAPAIEYNIASNSGLIFGPWFSVWGKNSGQFVNLVFSFYVSW